VGRTPLAVGHDPFTTATWIQRQQLSQRVGRRSEPRLDHQRRVDRSPAIWVLLTTESEG